jgi:hypothetical protein
MPEGSIERRLERIEERQQEMLVAIERLMQRAETNASGISSIVGEIGGVTDLAIRQGRPTLRDRVHRLENDTAAATAAKAALQAAQNARASNWTLREKVLVGACAVGTFALSVARAFGIG